MFPFRSIKNRLILILLLCSFTPLLLLRFVAFPKAQKDLEEALIRNLEGVKQKQVEIVKMWFDEKKRDAKVISRNVSSVMERNADDKSRGFPKLNEHLEMVKSEYGYKAVRITSRDGTVLVATERGCVGSNVMNDDYCREALNGNVFLSKIQYLVSGERKNKQSDGNVPVMFLSAPLLDSSNRITGAAVFTVDTLPLTEIMKSAKLGKTGETFLINREGCMLTESPFAGEIRKAGLVQQGTALALRVINPYTGKLTEGVQRCLSGNDGYDADGYKNYDGRKVLGAWRWIPEYDCGLLAQIDIREGYGAARSLKMFVLSMLLVLAFPLILTAFYFGKRISAPILKITEMTKRITSGDLGQRVKDRGKKDEISELARAFNVMAESLEEKTVKLRNYTADLENTVKERTLKLQETTNFLNSILAGSTEYSIIAEDLNGNILAFNKGASLIYGYAPEDMIGVANVRILHTEEDLKGGKVDRMLEIARATGRYEGEVFRKRKNGEVFPVHVTFTLRRDEKGQPIGFVVISKDITEEKTVTLEKEIVNNVNKIIASGLDIKEVYKNIYHELKRRIDYIWLGVASLVDGTEIVEDSHIVDGVLLSTDWLHCYRSMSYATAQDLSITQGIPVFVQDTQEGVYHFDGELSEKGIHSYICFPLKSKGITVGTVTLGSRKKDVFDEAHFGLLSQITPQLAIAIENTRLFHSTRESEKKYRDLVENAPEMIHEVSLKGTFINVNKTELNKLGYVLEEMRQMTLEDIVPPEYREEIKRLVRRIQETGSGELETVFLTKSGKEINVEINGTALYNAKTRECLCVRAFVRDITERKRMEEQVRRSEKLASMGELAAAIAHEIRNPLGAICNSVGILDSHLKLTGQDKHLLEMIVGQSERLDRIISAFLAFAHPGDPSFSLHDVREVIKNTLFLLEQDSRFTEQIELKEIYESVLPKVYIDPDLIHQVLWNLLINSLEAMPAGGQIRVMARKANVFLRDAVEIVISDTGIGIPVHELDKIFEPFYTTKTEGTGLGLSVVQRIIDDHGGTIYAKSKKDKGTTFYIKLPVGNEKLALQNNLFTG
ncbi:MAG: PAS domain S-box protein [Candidatus Brocadia sp.]|uniref:histidine kinase n=1 Tax=Candidatus Brocadia fulgida TaxID=380242 RepID=A0A0M2UZ35_9BACT|nr:MAG: two-component sensor kinase [Candidatus Brocadia fulgida]UJS20039.1 MAG: PAS domain S-box protein [Candidatus Brocadia sp.]